MATKQDTKSQTACYVYGIVPGDVETDPKAGGIGDPPSKISLIRHRDIAALVSEVETDRALGEPEDLTAHANVLDAAAAEVPVLPMRFGAVLDGQDAVTDELLAAHHDEFRDALRELEGKAQYVIKGRYEERAILTEILSENEDAGRLRESLRDKPEDATRNERMALGELIANAIEAKRQADTRQVVEALEKLGVRVNLRRPTHEHDAVHLACLGEVANQEELERIVGELAKAWKDRVQVRLLGPLAPYDFVMSQQPQG
jgi:hypothetical protein